jgi:AcrR family transcriptional regulator
MRLADSSAQMRTTSPPGGGRTRVRDPETTRATILAAAQTMMAEHGPGGLTVSDVARRAGVNRGTAYQHFPTRDRLVAAVLDRLGRGTKQALDIAAPDALDARIDGTVEYFVKHPELVRLSLFRMLGGIPHPSEDLWLDYLERMRQFAASPGARDGIDGDMLAVILLGATMLWSLRVQSGGATAAGTRRYLRELKRLMLYGVIRPERHADVVRALGELAGDPPRIRTTAARSAASNVKKNRRRAG